jgi:hypothetical protein
MVVAPLVRGGAGRHHDPGDARRAQLGHEVVERVGAEPALAGQLLHAGLVGGEADHLVAAAQQAAHHVASHPSQTHYPDLHGHSSWLPRGV